MITKDNLKEVLEFLGFKIDSKELYSKTYPKHNNCKLSIDFKNQKIIYPKEIIINDETTSNFSHPENFVVLECVHRLLEQGYNPKDIELEPKWQLGREAKGGKADIWVRRYKTKESLELQENKSDILEDSLLLIECKTTASTKSEFEKEWNRMQNSPENQLFSYMQQQPNTKFACLYTSDFVDSKLVCDYRLISMQDNDSVLKETGKMGYKDAYDYKSRWQIWQDTYAGEFSKLGLFEKQIQAYHIGKKVYSIGDLKTITSADISKKYHEFNSILRKFSLQTEMSNSFSKLMNLLLCKIIDEMQNKDKLQFFWKGFSYDNPLDFFDRLQKLYKEGMQAYLSQDVTYVEQKEIDRAFTQSKSQAKEIIDNLFKQLKYYSNSDFAFIEVYNKELFNDNFKVLLQVCLMLQDIHLTKSEGNQFLGDLFEGFLTKGVDQNEGSYFTPTPIVNFIIRSLPDLAGLEHKAIDFACGAGHFLTEYAKFHKKAKLVGIEKNHRLSKVAKVASFMYGQNIDIIYADALSSNEKFKNHDFDILISNPPYSVSGFLENLSENDREKFTKLFDKNINLETNANIECFFIEKSSQLLKENGICGIVLPNSLLNKDGIFEKTREILLRDFYINAIVELSNKTFAKTGTNTIILFATRKAFKNEDKTNWTQNAHFEDILEKYKANLSCEEIDNKYHDSKALRQSYCEFLNYDIKAYEALLDNKELDNNALFLKEPFSEYKKEYEKLEAKEKAEYNKKSKSYKEKNPFKTSIDLHSLIKEKELEKFLYFCYTKDSNLLIIKAPQDNKEQEKFLGYTWSNRKGSEGIKYFTQENIKEQDEADDEAYINNLNSINSINTPLYNPKKPNDENKLNFYVRQSFKKETIHKIPQDLAKYATYARLIDMLDFSRADFNKAISLNPKANIEISNFWGDINLIKLGEFASTIQTAKRPEGGVSNFTSGALSLGGEHIDNTSGYIKLNSPKYVPMEFYENFKKQDKGIVKKFDILICKDGALTGKIALIRDELDNKAAMINEHVFLIRCDNLIKQKYLFYILHSPQGQQALKAKITGAAQGGLNQTNLKNITIPNPKHEIQQQIVSECEKVEKQYKTIRMSIEAYQELIKAILQKCGIIAENNADGGALQTRSLEALLDLIAKLESSLTQNALPRSAYGYARNDSLESNKDATSSLRGEAEAIYNNFKTELKELHAQINTLPKPPKQGWEETTIIDIAESLIAGGDKPKVFSETKTEQCQIPIYANSTQNKGLYGYTNKAIVFDNALTISARGSLGYAVARYEPFVPIVRLIVLIPKIDKANVAFLEICINNKDVINTGANIPQLTIPEFSKFKIPLPPLNTQNQIVNIIENIEAKIVTLKLKQQNLDNQQNNILKRYLEL